MSCNMRRESEDPPSRGGVIPPPRRQPDPDSPRLALSGPHGVQCRSVSVGQGNGLARPRRGPPGAFAFDRGPKQRRRVELADRRQAQFSPDPANYAEEEWGVEDARLTWVEDRGQWIVAYTAFSHGGPLVSLAGTTDFVTFSRLGPAMPPENKDAAVFPRRFGNRYAMIHRPVSAGGFGAHVWISFSPDLKYWGEHQILLHRGAARGGTPTRSAWALLPWKRPRAGSSFTTVCA